MPPVLLTTVRKMEPNLPQPVTQSISATALSATTMRHSIFFFQRDISVNHRMTAIEIRTPVESFHHCFLWPLELDMLVHYLGYHHPELLHGTRNSWGLYKIIVM